MSNRRNINFEGELEEVRKLIDRGASKAAEEKARALLKQNPRDADLLSEIRLDLSRALELKARYQEALEAIQVYENPEVALELGFEQRCRLNIQIALTYNYLAEHHKSISRLKALANEIKEETPNKSLLGFLQVSFSRAYRALGQSAIANDFAEKSLVNYREAGDRRGMIQSYLALSNVAIQTGNPKASIEFGLQALNLIGDRPENYSLGRIYSDTAAACHYLREPEKGIEFLEKSIRYFALTEHTANAMGAYNNLGLHLMTIGEWKRSEEALLNSMRIARESNHPSLAVVCGTLGELYLKQGRLDEAETLLHDALRITEGSKRIWPRMTALGALAELAIERGDLGPARQFANEQLGLADEVNDPEGRATAHLHLAEISLLDGEISASRAQIERALPNEPESDIDPQLVGQSQTILARCALIDDDREIAIYHLERALAANELLKDVFLTSCTRQKLGSLLTEVEPKRAGNLLRMSAAGFEKLGLKTRADDCREQLANLAKTGKPRRDPKLNVAFILMRMAEASTSKKFLLKEFFSLISDFTRVEKSIFIEKERSGSLKADYFFGTQESEVKALIADFREHGLNGNSNADPDSDFRVTAIRGGFVLTHPSTVESFIDGSRLVPLMKQLELGLEICHLRESRESERAEKESRPFATPSLLPGFIHTSPEMTALAEEIYRIRESDVTVLVTGESGTGKELVSRSIHANSRRKDRMFVPVNCTALPKELAEGQLFGFRKGAFTGAAQDQEGLVRSAHQGTLFLDEIGDLPLDVQPKLLRFLQEGEIQPLGEKRPVKVDVRVVAATNASLEEKVKEGLFREDLYYRLNVIRLRVPPLRERRSEIPHLIGHYSKFFAEKFEKKGIVFLPQTVDLLMVCEWEGNVRQLCNEIQRIIARSENGDLISPEQLSPELKKIALPTSTGGPIESIIGNRSLAERGERTLAEVVEQLEKEILVGALHQFRGNISRISRELKISRRSLYMKLEKYELYSAPKNPYDY